MRTGWTAGTTPACHSSRMGNLGDEMDFSVYIGEQVRAVTHSAYYLQPAWCLFEGVSCGDTPGNTSYASIKSIYLSHLGLSGTLPDSIGNFRCLTHFDVGYNYLSGTIPATMSNWHLTVKELLMSHNQFTGFIPPSIGTCHALVVLTLDSNSLTGTIPSTICDMTSLTRLNLEMNSLIGTIPAQMFKLTQLTSLSLKSNFLTMGSASFISEATFSEATKQGTLLLLDNCVSYESITNPNQKCSATRCHPTDILPRSEYG